MSLKTQYPYQYQVMGGIMNDPYYVQCRILGTVEGQPWYISWLLKIMGFHYQVEWVCEYGTKIEWASKHRVAAPIYAGKD